MICLKRSRRLTRSFLATMVMFVTLVLNTPDSSAAPDELTIKAGFIKAFVNYIQTNSEKTVCVINNKGVFSKLRPILSSDKVIDVSSIAGNKCTIAFFNSGNIKSLISESDRNSVISMSDKAGFLNSGGMIEIYIKEGRPKFSLNLKKAKALGVKLNSKLIELADKTI